MGYLDEHPDYPQKWSENRLKEKIVETIDFNRHIENRIKEIFEELYFEKQTDESYFELKIDEFKILYKAESSECIQNKISDLENTDWHLDIISKAEFIALNSILNERNSLSEEDIKAQEKKIKNGDWVTAEDKFHILNKLNIRAIFDKQGYTLTQANEVLSILLNVSSKSIRNYSKREQAEGKKSNDKITKLLDEIKKTPSVNK
ncbi:hypothetical protein ACTS95_02265 [Empedobacter brevis]